VRLVDPFRSEPAKNGNSKLFLETSMPTSASPYPSPSSAFYPPPIPASHEFANKIANNKRYRGGVAALVTGGTNPSTTNGTMLSSASEPGSRRTSDAFLGSSPGSSRQGSDALKAAMGLGGSAPGSRRQSRDANATSNQDFSVNGSGSSSRRESGNPKPIPETKGAWLPLARWLMANHSIEEPSKDDESPVEAAESVSTSTPADPLQSSSTSSGDQTQPSPLNRRISLSLTPLTPSRPAPPSPAPSRRPSLARRGSSKRSTSSRDANQTGPSSTPDKTSRRQSNLSMTFNYLSAGETHPEETEETTAKTPREKTPIGGEVEGAVTKPIIVRDFAFLEDDERFSKRPVELLPRSERPGTSTSHDGGEEEDEWEEDDCEEWRDLRYEPNEEGELTPLPDASHAYDYQPTGTGENAGEEGEEIPLRPGIYRALYVFEAEGTAEMSLAEGDLVRVVGSGGVGWAVVERGWKPDVEEHLNVEGVAPEKKETDEIAENGSGALGLAGQALVPESYLEAWELDEWRED
jgi:hypothetical protein